MYYFGLKSHSMEIKSKPKKIKKKNILIQKNSWSTSALLATFSGVKARLVKIHMLWMHTCFHLSESCNKLSEIKQTKIYVIAWSFLSLMRILASMSSPDRDRPLLIFSALAPLLKYLDAQLFEFLYRC